MPLFRVVIGSPAATFVPANLFDAIALLIWIVGIGDAIAIDEYGKSNARIPHARRCFSIFICIDFAQLYQNFAD
jgi:hypothetical protein